jgi:ABC-type transporter Mla subunit MlaD
MVDLALEHRVRAEWHSIARIAEQTGLFLTTRRESKPSLGALITQLSDLIDNVDQVLAENLARKDQIEAVAAQIAQLPLEEVDRFSESIADARRALRDQEMVLRAQRLQMMDAMIQINPEDAWVYEPDNLAALRAAEADVAAGRVTRYESDEEFFAGLDRIYADAHP